MRTIEWDSNKNQLNMIDQRLLPGRFEVVTYDDYRQVAAAIRDMVVRGAPAIGASAAFGIALAACRSNAAQVSDLRLELYQAAEVLKASRPTAVNLFWAVQRMMALVDLVEQQPEGSGVETTQDLCDRLVREAQRIADEDIEINRRMAAFGAELIEDGDTVIHHCNTGALATVDWGTALGVIRMAYEQGKKIHVLVDETRPRLQGARLTAWELEQYGIPYEIITDNAAGYMLRTGRAQKVFFGADRVAANGDVANKIGTYMLSLAAHANAVPVYAVVPTSTVDLTLASGDLIPIEERGQDEVLDIQVKGERVAPEGAKACNPAFDVTPNALLTAIITERGVVYPPFIDNLTPFVRGE
jgi:methylthioribose-1-phosphate isomerase